jgi:hypothetical protein
MQLQTFDSSVIQEGDMLPFTREQFFDVFTTYNEAIWPAQVALLALGLAMLGALRLHRHPRWVGWALGALWVWTGIAYHAVFFASINPLAYAFAALFLIQGGLMARASRRGTLRFGFPRDMPSLVVGAVLLAYALLGYPLVAIAAGQSYPALPTFGVPCPTVIFTFGLLAWSARPTWPILMIPIAWALLGISAATQLGVPEDWGLPVAAVAVVLLRLRHRRVPSGDELTLQTR